LAHQCHLTSSQLTPSHAGKPQGSLPHTQLLRTVAHNPSAPPACSHFSLLPKLVSDAFKSSRLEAGNVGCREQVGLC